MFKIEILPFLHCAVDGLLNPGSVVRMSSLEHELHRRFVGWMADSANGSAPMLNWLVEEKQIKPHIPVIDKSKREEPSS